MDSVYLKHMWQLCSCSEQPLWHDKLLMDSTLCSLTDATCLCPRLTAEQLPRAGHLPYNVSYFRHFAAQECLLSCNACGIHALSTATRPCTEMPLCRLSGVHKEMCSALVSTHRGQSCQMHHRGICSTGGLLRCQGHSKHPRDHLALLLHDLLLHRIWWLA